MRLCCYYRSMRQILLVSGLPHAGKTTLMHQLAAEHAFAGLSVDDAYVTFIRTHCQPIDFPALGYYILQHYEAILRDQDRSMVYLGRDFLAEWLSHILARIVGFSSLHEKIVVEGYLVKDVPENGVRTQTGASVASVRVEGGRYSMGGQQVTIEQITANA
jgi:hypothetical protein